MLLRPAAARALRLAPSAATLRLPPTLCRPHLPQRRALSAQAGGFEAQVSGLELVQVALEGHVATLTINRPKALNALSAAVVSELHSAIDALETLVPDATLRCLIVTGAGDRAFVAGADIAGMVGMSPEDAAAYAATTHSAFRRLEHFPTPVLAAVNGFALGGGCELAQACDIIYASEKAKFGQPEVNLGLMPGFAGTVRLPRRATPAAAAEWTFTGELHSAAEAKEVGLVHKVLPPAELLPHVQSVAELISAKAPVAVRAAKKAIVTGLGVAPDEAAAAEVEAFGELFATEDAQEGCTAFVEKREAVWTGR